MEVGHGKVKNQTSEAAEPELPGNPRYEREG